jgi:hypothetical protein
MRINVRTEKELQRLVSQIALRVKEEVIHTFLSEMSIQRLEAIIEKAKENRRTRDHNDYTALAEVWRNEERRMTIDTNVTTQNPYRAGSKLHSIFNFIADGEHHTLGASSPHCVSTANDPPASRRVRGLL